MGLLDDAIREHLELKRKHGADPEDVARQEREALGPGQRNEFAQPDAAPADVATPAEEPATTIMPPDEPTDAVAADEAPPEEPTDAGDALPEGEPGIPEEPTAEHPAAAPGYDEDPWLEEDQDEVPADEALESRPAPPTGEEDVLEETPEFLQETPEHDRLWFEQKPPRDFDWDK
jgi:hypothetical protein